MGASVSTWPTYLLNGIPDELREQISAEAEERNLSLADTIRAALCAHYGLDCPPVNTKGYRGEDDKGATRMFLRLQPELFEAIVGEVRTQRQIVLDILTEHYGKEPA